MLVSDSHKFILFHYPKTGGSSMTEVLGPYLTPSFKSPEVKFMGWQAKHHYDSVQHSSIINCMYAAENQAGVPRYPNEYFKASFVRNPYSLVVSAWDGKMSFHDFVTKVLPSGKVFMKEYFWTQHQYLSNDRGNILVDFVGRFEHLEIDWQKFCYLTRLPKLKLPNLNTSDKGDYRQYYNEQTYRIVNKIFKNDFNFFKYSQEL